MDKTDKDIPIVIRIGGETIQQLLAFVDTSGFLFSKEFLNAIGKNFRNESFSIKQGNVTAAIIKNQ